MEEIMWENDRRGWYKDIRGNVWLIQETPYKEVPVIILPPREDIREKIDAKAEDTDDL